ncbi:MAG: hypothetical protein HY908_28645 [Myxococcales bacterium]|nr:hypothetical protein [Myxococcales bacterium]
MSPEAIERRLREVSAGRTLRPPFPPSVDMGPDAIARRLHDAAQLHALERELRARRAEDPRSTVSAAARGTRA